MESKRKDIAQMSENEHLMKAKQIENYKKKRLDTFDFAYIGETEDFSLSL